jgi:hypothetical protein
MGGRFPAPPQPRQVHIDVEVQLPHNFHELRDRIQVSLLQRNIGAAQGLGQPRDLQTGIVLGRIELSPREA